MAAVRSLAQVIILMVIVFQFAKVFGKYRSKPNKSGGGSTAKRENSGRHTVQRSEASFRSGGFRTGDDWLARQVEAERASARRMFSGEKSSYMDDHAFGCEADFVRSSHSAVCEANRVERDTRSKLSREEIEARKVELRRKYGR